MGLSSSGFLEGPVKMLCVYLVWFGQSQLVLQFPLRLLYIVLQIDDVDEDSQSRVQLLCG